MGEKEEKKNKGGGEKKKGGGEKKVEAGPTPVVLKVDMHCEGCALKVKKAVKGFPGVDAVSTDMANNKITVVGNVDPLMIRERLETKTRKKVDLISPVPKKDSAPKESESKKPQPDNAKEQKKPDDKKPKPPASSTVVLKIRLHCDGCIQRIRKTILRIRGVETVNIDSQKDLVTVKGTMDVNALTPYLKDKLKRSVDIVPEKKEGGGGNGDKKEKGGGGGENKEKGGGNGEKKEKGGDGDKKEKEKGKGDGGEKKKEVGSGEKEGGSGEKKKEVAAAPSVVVEGNKMEYYGPYGYGGGPGPAAYGYGYGYGGPYGNVNAGYRVEMVHAPQIFSDENPNACSIM